MIKGCITGENAKNAEKVRAGCCSGDRIFNSGRPLGDESFVDHIEALLARSLRPQKPVSKRVNE